MAFVVAESCIKCKYTDCVSACPVDCFYEGPDFLVIHPDECVDCGACVPECPVEAIFESEELPDEWKVYKEINARLSLHLPNISEQKVPLPEADHFREVKGKSALMSLTPELYDLVRDLLPEAGSAAEAAEPVPADKDNMRHQDAANVTVPEHLDGPVEQQPSTAKTMAAEKRAIEADAEAAPEKMSEPSAAERVNQRPAPEEPVTQATQALAESRTEEVDPSPRPRPASTVPAPPKPQARTVTQAAPEVARQGDPTDPTDVSALRKLARKAVPAGVRGRLKKLLGR